MANDSSLRRDLLENLAGLICLFLFVVIVVSLLYLEVTEQKTIQNRWLDMILVFLIREIGGLVVSRVRNNSA